MSRIAVVTVLAMAACAFASEAQTALSPARVALEQMSQAERKNSCLSVEFESSDSDAKVLGHQVEQLWNNGRFDEALVQLGNLEARVGHVAIGNSWRKPVPTREAPLGPETRIGNRDSLQSFAFDIHRQNGNYFAALRHSSGPDFYSVCMSTDNGATWAETFTWYGSAVTLLDCGSIVDHFGVAYYSPGENARQVRYRWFLNSDGSAAEFNSGDKWVAACTLDVGDTAKALSYVSSGFIAHSIVTLVSDGSVLFSNNVTDGERWYKFATGITSGARSGLDAAPNVGNSSRTNDLFSYLDGTDTLRIYGWKELVFSQRLALFCGTGVLTSISAYRDTVVCAYEDGTMIPQGVRYASSTDGGSTWTTGSLSDSGVAAEAPAVTAPRLGGLAAVFREGDSTPGLWFCQRIDSGPWSDPVSIADNEPYRGSPSVRRTTDMSRVFGVVYLSDTTPVVRGAYFLRYEPPYVGLAEQQWPLGPSHRPQAAVVRGGLLIEPGMGDRRIATCDLLDAAGRKVTGLHVGTNDVRTLAPGVYFVREGLGTGGKGLGKTRKVVVTR
jgi:hypothetical protein